MPSYTSEKLAFNNAEQFKESFFEPEPTTIGYVFLGNHIAWPNEDSPPTITDTVATEKSLWDNMFAGKKITGNDVELVIPKVIWTGNTKYRQFDDTIQLSELISSNISQNLKPIYALTSDRNVYLCLSNNVSANSTVEPTGKNLSANGIIQTADNYIWKYLYNIRASNKFFSETNDFIPAPTSTARLDYDSSPLISVDGELVQIVVSNGGSGYIHSSIFVPTFVTGCTIISVANTTNLAANMAISGTGISSQTHIVSIDLANVTIELSAPPTANGGGSNTANSLTVQSRVYINGDGTSILATTALSGNTIQKVNVTSFGKNFSVANVFIYGTGTGAVARAVLPTKYGHGINSAKQLGASNVMISMRIGEVDSTENGIISTDTTFRQYGFLRDPYKYNSVVAANNTVSNTVFSQTTDITLVAGSNYNLNEFVFQGPSANTSTFSGFVHAFTSNVIRLTKVKGSPSFGGLALKGTETNPVGRTIVSVKNPEFQPGTGDILYEENIVKTQRTDGQAESLKFVIRF